MQSGLNDAEFPEVPGGDLPGDDKIFTVLYNFVIRIK